MAKMGSREETPSMTGSELVNTFAQPWRQLTTVVATTTCQCEWEQEGRGRWASLQRSSGQALQRSVRCGPQAAECPTLSPRHCLLPFTCRHIVSAHAVHVARLAAQGCPAPSE